MAKFLARNESNILSSRHSAFTVVELLVVIVLIGILATISLISYSGISNKATVASLKADLSSASKQLKVYQATNDKYPNSVIDCPSPTTGNICLKFSNGNQVDSYTVNNTSNPQAFTLVGKDNNDNNKYQVSESSSPVAYSPPAIFTTGGTITYAGGIKTHTFGISCTSVTPCSVTATASGEIAIVISGGGGGGGGGADCDNGMNGIAGGYSSLTYNSGTWRANGGGAGTGGTTDCYTWASPGTNGSSGSTQVSGSATMTGWSAINGGGALGGIGGSGNLGGGSGGKGGKLTGNLSVDNSQTIDIIAGGAGAGGAGAGGVGLSGTAGASGSVILSYPY